MQSNQCYWIIADASLYVWYFMSIYQEKSKWIKVYNVLHYIQFIVYLLHYNKLYFLWD